MDIKSFFSGKAKWFRISAIILTIISLIILSAVSFESEQISLGTIIGFAIAIFFVGFLIFFGREIFDYINQKRKPKDEDADLPEPKSEEEMINKVRDIFEKPKLEGGYENHIKSIINRDWRTSGGNQIFLLTVEPLYKDTDPASGKAIKFFNFIFNAHTPENPTIKFNLEDKKAIARGDRMAKNPEEKDIEEVTTRNPLLGTETTTKKTSKKQKEKQNKKEQEET